MSDGEGLEAPVHRSLVAPLLVAGLPRSLTFLVWTLTAALVLGLRQVWVLPLALVLHALLARAMRQDPYLFDVARRAVKAPRRLEP